MILGLVPFFLLGYGLWTRKKGFIWAGAIWLGLAVVYAIYLAGRAKGK
jgi:hypothetical protein